MTMSSPSTPARPAAPADISIEPMRPGDWDQVASIYAEGIATGESTFETTVPSWERWEREHVPELRLVAREGDRVLG